MINRTVLQKKKKKDRKGFIDQESWVQKPGIFSFPSFCFDGNALWSVLSSTDSILPFCLGPFVRYEVTDLPQGSQDRLAIPE
jgi:hypothetical protein